jgi:hypothetical protein
MTDNIDNLVLEHLRHIRGKVDKNEKEMDALKTRMTRLELAMVSVKREVSDGFEADIHQHKTNDSLLSRIERIESQLDLHD